MMMYTKNPVPVHYSDASVVKHEVFIYDEIGGPENYIDLIKALEDANENEIFHIRIASVGGNMFGAIALIHALMKTKALTIGSADSIVASAGTLIFFACQKWEIGSFALFMFHDGSTVSEGKFNENKKSLDAITRVYTDLGEQLYKPFFNDEELKSIYDGSDLYIHAQEMADRINRVMDEQTVELEKELEEPELLVEKY